jgi:hypothetical protein
MPDQGAKPCQGCGQTITPEQIVARQAGLVQGMLLCPACVDQKRKEAMLAAQRAAAAEAPIALDATDGPKPGEASSKIRSFATASSLGGEHHDEKLKRHLGGANEPPTRCRTFHSKLTPAALSHMDELINEWLDTHPDVFIKHVATTVGPFEAKHVEQHLIVSIFY